MAVRWSHCHWRRPHHLEGPRGRRRGANRASAYNGLGEYQRAIEDLNEAIRLDPKYAFDFANRALAYTYLGRDLEAQQDAERAIELGADRGILKTEIEEAKRNR